MVKKMKKYMYLDTDSCWEDEVVVVLAENSSEAEQKMINYLMEKDDYDEDEAKAIFDEFYTELTIRKTLE